MLKHKKDKGLTIHTDYLIGSEQENRFLFIKAQYYLTIIFIAPFIFYRLYEGNYAIAVINTVVVSSVVLVYRFINNRNNKRYAVVISYIIPIFYSAFAFSSIRLSSGDNIFLIYSISFIFFFSVKPIYALIANLIYASLSLHSIHEHLDDYVLIQIAISYFLMCLIGLVLIKKMDKLVCDLRQFSLYDVLTKARNKKALQEDARRFSQLNELPDFTNSIYMLLLDIDDFDKVNEKYGYFYGDHAIINMKNNLDKYLGSRDMLYYYESDKFIVVSENTEQGALLLAETLRKRTNKSKIHKFTQLSVSIGIKKLQIGEPFEHWLEETQHALQQAKNMGKNCVAFAEESTP